MLDKLGKSVACYDTDGIVYIDSGQDMIKTGCILGQQSDELGKDKYIKKWLSTGPKSYGFLTNKEKEIEKIQGFTLNYKNSKHLNLKAIKKLQIRKQIKII